MPLKADKFAAALSGTLALERGQFKTAPQRAAGDLADSANQFAQQMTTFLAAVGGAKVNAIGVFRRQLGTGFSRVVARTPVRRARSLKGTAKTRKRVPKPDRKAVPGGRARAGWRIETVTDEPNELHLRWVNGVEYIVYLEYGWSKQAPAGMVRVTLAELRSKLAELAFKAAGNG